MFDNTLATVYNPHTQSKQELIDAFVVRHPLFHRLFKQIKQADMRYPQPHILIQGQRGMGKTTLLLRLCYAVENDAELNPWLLPVVLPEEAYWRINRLDKLWLALAETLADNQPAFADLIEQMEALPDDADFERSCFALLEQRLQQQQQKLLFFIDNLGELFRNFSEQENQRLREILMNCADLRLISASALVAEAYFKYQHPFYEFFKIYHLKGLDKIETYDLLRQLARHHNQQDQMQYLIENEAGRIESLRMLTGGVVRTLVLLFEIFIDNKNGQAVDDLEAILDRVTPLYKHRMDELEPIQRVIVDAVALHWDSISINDIASKTRLNLEELKPHLQQLEDNTILKRLPSETDAPIYYLQERFFNIWYLMRQARRNAKQQVVWLVRFLAAFYGQQDLQQRAQQHIHAIQQGGYRPKSAYFMTEALAHTALLDRDTEHQLIQTTRDYLGGCDVQLAKRLSASDKELWELAQVHEKKKEWQKALNYIKEIKNKTSFVIFKIASLFDELDNYSQAEQYYLKEIDEPYIGEAMLLIATLYQTQHKDYRKAKYYYLKSIEKGNSEAMHNLAILYAKHYKNYDKAKQYYSMAVDKGQIESINNLANLYKDKYQDYAKAEKYYLIGADKGDTNSIFNLAFLYKDQHKNYIKAKKYFLMMVDEGNTDAMVLLALLYKNQYHNYYKAEKYFLMAANEGNINSMLLLAVLYESQYKYFSKAEKYYLMAIKQGDKKYALKYLMNLYVEKKLWDKLEKLYPLAIEKKHTEVLNGISWVSFEYRILKDLALNSAKLSVNLDNKFYNSHTLACVQLWHDHFQAALTSANGFMHDHEFLEKAEQAILDFLLLLLAKQQYTAVDDYFNQTDLDLKTRFKPVYFALLTLQNSPDARLCPQELQEAVVDILEKIKKLAVDYA